jgi:hypothetical protein
VAGYSYALTSFGYESPGCCHAPPPPIAGVLSIAFPIFVLATLGWFVFSGLVSRRPVAALVVGLLSLPIAIVLGFVLALAVTPL